MRVTCVCVPGCFSRVWFLVTLWTVACQASLSMGFLRQEYWSGLPRPFQGIFPTQGPNLHFLCLLHSLAGRFFITSTTRETSMKVALPRNPKPNKDTASKENCRPCPWWILMQKYSTKCYQSDSTAHWKDYTSWPSEIYSWNARMAQHKKIN